MKNVLQVKRNSVNYHVRNRIELSTTNKIEEGVLVSVATVTHHRTELRAWNFGNNFGRVIRCDVPSIIKIGPCERDRALGFCPMER